MSNSTISPGHVAPGGELRLPLPPGFARRFWARHPWVTDAVVAGSYLVPMSLGLMVVAVRHGPLPPMPLVVQVTTIVVVTLALLFRRHAPLWALVVTAAGLLASVPDYGPVDALPVLIALYAVAVYRGAGSAWIGLAAAALVGSLDALVATGAPTEVWAALSIQSAIAMLAATLIGVNVGDRKRYVAKLVDLAAQLARERDQQAQLARVSERSRIAREMHDIVAHSLSIMVALADGADAIIDKDPQRSRSAIRDVASTGRGSMVEMRRLLGVLAEDPVTDAAAAAPLRPQPGLDQLVELVESFRSAGLPTRFAMTGPVPANPGLQLTVYRIVQEALTNALRYAVQPSRVSVKLSVAPGEIEVLVTDDGRRAAAAVPGTGRGLLGMAERVALYGGTLDAGARSGPGWQVRARVPFEEDLQP